MSMDFSASADSDSAITVRWNYQDHLQGVYAVVSTVVTQSGGGGDDVTQTFGATSSVGATVFGSLKPSTSYDFEIVASGEDQYGDVEEIFTNSTGCTTLPLNRSPPPPPPPPPPRPSCSDLKAAWSNAPSYTAILITFVGVNIVSWVVKLSGAKSGSSARQPGHSSTAPSAYSLGLIDLAPGAYEVEVDLLGPAGTTGTGTTSVAAPPGPGAITAVVASWNEAYTAVDITWAQGGGTPTMKLELNRFAGAFSAKSSPQKSTSIPLALSYVDVPSDISLTSEYQYQLVATNEFGSKAAVSNLVGPPTAPGPPANGTASWSEGYEKLTLKWDAVEHAETYDVSLYEIGAWREVWQVVSGWPALTAPNVEIDLAGSEVVGYQFSVIARNRFGPSAAKIFAVPGVPMVSQGTGSVSGPSEGAGHRIIWDQS